MPRGAAVALYRRHPLQTLPLLALLATAATLFAIGVSEPTITLEKFVIARKTYSILGGLAEFWQHGRWFLLLVVGVFSLLFPAFKILLMTALWFTPASRRSLRLLVETVDHLGRWSMLDVFVVAVLVATVQLGFLAKVTVHEGLYAFGGCVLLTMVASTWVLLLARRV